MRELHAWENGHHVGVFSEDDEERISFAYDANEGLPISLSLPRTGGWRDQAPRNFLDNLLPDNPNVRQAMMVRGWPIWPGVWRGRSSPAYPNPARGWTRGWPIA
ncbi:MAG: HipA N-terminal domain-containing protein [Bifidobacterium breve]|nr:HipA N-terminal domain-containing protein [Bifidobacterium breve]